EARDALDESADAVGHLVEVAHAIGARAHALTDVHEGVRRAVDRIAARRRGRGELADRLFHRLRALAELLGRRARLAHVARAVEGEAALPFELAREVLDRAGERAARILELTDGSADRLREGIRFGGLLGERVHR